jgi:DNA-binding transcriptional MerR regulator
MAWNRVMAPQLLTSKDVGVRLGVGADRVRALCREGRISPAAVTPNGVRLFDEQSILKFQRDEQRSAGAA